jgi:protein-disulfide isomerase
VSSQETIPASPAAEHVAVGASPESAPPRMGPRLVIAGLIVAALAAAMFLGGGSGAPDATPGAASDTGHPVLGAADAPVVMLNYSDFQCGFCRRYTAEVEPALITEYVNTGRLRMEWRDFPVLGDASVRAALAGRAAHEQDAFWAYHGLLYANQEGGFDDDSLVAVAARAGLDVAQFRAALATNRYQAEVQADFEEGQQLGLTGTPSFVINGQLVVGAQPLEVFRQVIEQALAQAGDV